MRYVIFASMISIILQIYIVSKCFCYKGCNVVFRWFNVLVFLSLFVLCFYNMNMFNEDVFSLCFIFISLFFVVYVFLVFVWIFTNRNRYISLFSVKGALDKSYNGIMFFDRRGEVFLINNSMRKLLCSLEIYDCFLEQLISKSFKKINDDYLLRNNSDVWLIKVISLYEVHAIMVTDIYKLNEEYEKQNRFLEEYNKRLIDVLERTKETRKGKNLIKIKNEFHDLLGHRLSLFKGYLDSDNISINDIKYIINNLFIDDSKIDSIKKLNKLVEIYKVLGININVKGKLPGDKIGDTFFEVIREGITNAILHGGSRNIDVNIKRDSMIISNDGTVPSSEIIYGEGIKGMKRKLALLGGYLVIEYKDRFVLTVKI